MRLSVLCRTRDRPRFFARILTLTLTLTLALTLTAACCACSSSRTTYALSRYAAVRALCQRGHSRLVHACVSDASIASWKRILLVRREAWEADPEQTVNSWTRRQGV